MKTYFALFCLSLLALIVVTTDDVAAQTPDAKPVTVTQIFKRDHPEQKDRDVIVQRIEVSPEASAPPHVHPGMVTGYVVSGTLEFQIAGEIPLTLRAGDTFFEPPGSKHILARNPSKSEKTVLIAFVVNPKDQPVAHPMDAHK